MKKAALIFPHQLFQKNPVLKKVDKVILIEENLFFKQYSFHKQKLAFHRASMKFYESYLKNKNYKLDYIESIDTHSDIRELIPHLKKRGVDELHFIEVSDNWLNNRLTHAADEANIKLVEYDSPMFINSMAEINDYFKDRVIFRQTDFYTDQRKKRGILINESNKPIGGKWTYDTENRYKYPRGKSPPVVSFPSANKIPLNSLEGFIRQIIGWREFIRATYELRGSKQRTKNFWGFSRKIPESFWEGNTGVEPLDIVIKKVLETGYCHHIERLMVLGNFMLLCEFDPDEIYRWFMEMFIDAYDWVMVPNVYGMSQFSDGGLMASKPYISSSNYLMKMSDFKKGEWQKYWDALFWRFMHVHREFFTQNPRTGMLIRTFDNKSNENKKHILEVSEDFINNHL